MKKKLFLLPITISSFVLLTSCIPNTVYYKVTLINLWSTDKYPANYPDDAHFSWLGGATHNHNITFWQPGQQASHGIKQMAETGRVDNLVNQEIQAAIDSGHAYSSLFEQTHTSANPNNNSSIRIIEVSANYSLVSLVSMLGPSPDWFVGVSGVNLIENGQWVEKKSVDLALYDAGTEEGIIPSMDNPPTIPPLPIHLVGYDHVTGTYQLVEKPQIVGKLIFEQVVNCTDKLACSSNTN